MTTSIIPINSVFKKKYNLYLFQPQYSATINGKRQYWLPYSVGCLWSYASQFIDITAQWKLCNLIFRRELFDNLDLQFSKNTPSLCGFSVYAWNQNYCLYISKLIKQQYPECKIIFGGPQCYENMPNEYPFIDSVVLAEGEETFVEILRSYATEKPIAKIYKKHRLDNLEIPSPYTTGVFDKLIKENPSLVWSTVIESNRGCPYACTFCDWGSLTYSKVKKFNLKKVAEELEWIRTNPIVFVTSADANFGIFKERDMEVAKLIRKASDFGNVQSVAVTYAKNSYSDIFDIAKILEPIGRGVTVSVQSMNEETLTEIKRKNMKVNDIAEMMRLSEHHNIPAYTELILALPLETKESWRNSLTDLLEVGQHYQIDVYFCIILKGSELASLESRKKYGLKTIQAYDYVAFTETTHDEVVLPEEFEIVVETNTLSHKDVIECYLYGWMIIQFHCIGYTQMYAKYCRNVLGIPYQEFYNKFFDIIKQDNILSEHFLTVEKYVYEHTTLGKIVSSDIQSVHLTTFSYPIIYNIKEHVFDLAKKCYQIVSGSNKTIDWLDKLSKILIYDVNQPDDIVIELPYDIGNWEKIQTKYQIELPSPMNTKRKYAPASTARNGAFYKNIYRKI